MRLSTMAARRGRTARRSAPTGRKLRNVIPHTRFYLIRHAEVENPNRVLYGHLDGFPLSALGRAQAAAVGEGLRHAAVTRIVHSPLERAAETARIIAEKLTPRPVLEADSELREAEFSRYLQGVPFWQIPVRRPLWLVHKARRGLPGRGRQPQRRLVGVGAEAGTDRKRRYLGCRNRPLSPLSRRLRAAARAEPERASAFHRVVTHRAVGGRVRFEADAPLPRRAGRATRAGNHADGHASPLHEPALVREQGRMDGRRRASR